MACEFSPDSEDRTIVLSSPERWISVEQSVSPLSSDSEETNGLSSLLLPSSDSEEQMGHYHHSQCNSPLSF